jgi:hypothetical protein
MSPPEGRPHRRRGVAGRQDVAAAFAPHRHVVQRKPRRHRRRRQGGAAGAQGPSRPVLVVFADAPLITTATCSAGRGLPQAKAAVGVLGFISRDPTPYGRLVTRRGMLEKIVESRDADETEKAVDFCNSGVMCLDGALIGDLLGAIKNDNVKSEFYITDVVAIARGAGRVAIAVEGDEAEFQGINSRAELAMAEKAMQQRLRAAALEAGVGYDRSRHGMAGGDTKFAADVTIGPNVRFGTGVSVGRGHRDPGLLRHRGRRIGRSARHRSVRASAGLRRRRRRSISAISSSSRPTRHEPRAPRPTTLAYLGDSEIGAAEQCRRRHHLRELRRLRQVADRGGCGRLHWFPTARLVAPSHWAVLQCDRRQRHHRGRAGRRRGLRARPPGHKEGAGRQPLRAKLKAVRQQPNGSKNLVLRRLSHRTHYMCGIIGIIGKAPVTPLLVEALKRLEYRGYDSAGVATLVNGHIERRAPRAS